MPYYRATYHSTSGGNCPRLQALADRFGSVLVDVIIQTDEPLDDPQPVLDYLTVRPDYAGFSS